MGRPIKKGLDYFPMFVDFYEDTRMQFISGRFGLKGTDIVMRLLCRIYREGYYIEFDDDYSLLFAISVGDKKLHGLVNDIVQESVKRGFFDKDIFNQFNILTSSEIQSNFIRVSTERSFISIIKEYWLIEIPPDSDKRKIKICTIEERKLINPPINSVSPPKNSVNRSINAQRKEKESKVSYKTSSSSNISIQDKYLKPKSEEEEKILKVLETYKANINSLPSPIEVEHIRDWLNEVEPDVIILAVETAVLNNGKSLNYIKRIIDNWICQGLATGEQVKAYLENWKRNRNGVKDTKLKVICGNKQDEQQAEFLAKIEERKKRLMLDDDAIM